MTEEERKTAGGRMDKRNAGCMAYVATRAINCLENNNNNNNNWGETIMHTGVTSIF